MPFVSEINNGSAFYKYVTTGRPSQVRLDGKVYNQYQAIGRADLVDHPGTAEKCRPESATILIPADGNSGFGRLMTLLECSGESTKSSDRRIYIRNLMR